MDFMVTRIEGSAHCPCVQISGHHFVSHTFTKFPSLAKQRLGHREGGRVRMQCAGRAEALVEEEMYRGNKNISDVRGSN